MVLDYVITVWDAAEPKTFNAEIYTDWANHYLEKARNKRFITNLQQDITDGVLLADVIEAVTNEKVRDIKTKPKNSAQMVENVNTCLTFLANIGVNVEGLSAKDIKDGNLKAILGLFFSLSRFKQQQKSQQQKQEQKSHPVGACTETQNTSTGRNTPQINGGEMQSKLPSPFKQGSKCPTITNPSIKDSNSARNHNTTQIKSPNTNAAINEKSTRLHQNIQNNNNTAGSSLTSKNNNNNNNNNNQQPSRATSPSSVGSGIPTPGGRALTSSARSQSLGERTSRSTNIPTTATAGPATPTRAQSLKSSPTNKNSMLDKFKFFNSKDKSKSKSTVVKSASKTSTNSTLSSSSRSDTDSRDSKSSASARSSSSTDPGVSTSTSTDTADSGCPRTPVKSKSFARSLGGKKETHNTLTVEQNAKRTISSTSPQARTPSPNTTAISGKKSGKVPKGESKLGHTSPSPTKKGSKIGSLIPKTQGKSKSSSSNSLSSQGNSTQIPTQPRGIPKLSSSKSTKSSKEDKSKSSSRDKNSSLPSSSHAQKSNNAKQSPQNPQVLHQQQGSRIRSAPQTPVSTEPIVHQSNDPQGCNSLGRHGRSEGKMNSQSKTHYTEIEYADGRIERIGEGQYSKPSHLALPMMRLISTTAVGQNSPQNSQYSSIQKASPGYNTNGHMTSSSQAINVVKPTCSTVPHLGTKADGNTQTTLSVLQRTASIQNTPLPKPPRDTNDAGSNSETSESSNSHTSGSVSTPGNSDSTPSSASHSGKSGNSGSSGESVIFRPSSCDEMSGSERSVSSATSSPKLGISNVLHNRPANNIAIVQPRSGEKVETTFDTEVRTEKIHKLDNNSKSSKETTFSENETTFVDDSGEALDIKPMAPIMRSLPYGYLRGYAGSPAKNYNLGVSVTPTSAYYATSASSRLGMNRPLIDHGKYGYSSSGPIKRTMSQGHGNVMDTDYSSDYDTYDYVSGYMSDGDILKSSSRTDDTSSGYLSEGGASLYARRLQQRFREGMQAVKECMQKSSGLIDDDSFDDSSSISSGEISDTIAEISTDEGNLTGGSSQSETNPYSSLKRAPRDINNGGLQVPVHTKRVPNLGTSAFLGTDYSSDSGQNCGWKKYSLPQTNRLLSSDPADYAYLYNGYDQMQWRKHEQAGIAALRKFSNASQPEIYYGGRNSDAESVKSSYSANGSPAKRDSETNTDHSHLMEASMKKVQGSRGVGVLPGGHGYGYRRPLSNLSTSSAGSNKSNGSGKHSNVGTRLAKHGLDKQSENVGTNSHQEVPASSLCRTGRSQSTDMGPESYNSATLENKRRGLPSSRSVSGQTSDSEIYKSNTLGRRAGRMFGSRNSLTKSSQGDSVNGNMFCSTIISNPHATFGKSDSHPKMGYNGVAQSQQQSPQSGAHSPYMILDYSSPRNSGASPNGQWLKTSNGTHNGIGTHTPLHMSETESMESLSSQASSIQAQIQQARALSGASARILAHQRDSAGELVGLHRSNSVKSTQSECLYQNTQHCLAEDLTRTNSFSQLPSPPPPSSPTPSNSSHSSRFTYPMAAYASPAMLNSSLTQNMVRSNTQSSLPYGSLAMSKMNKDEDSSLHGSNLSLVSSSSSVYSTSEEKQAHEIQKLRRELCNAQDKVSTLTTQLNTNAHVVAAFEQSLSNMTARLQTLTATAEQKTGRCSQDSELNDLRVTIESLKSQSGLGHDPSLISPHVGRRHTSPGMVNDLPTPPHPTPQGPRLFHTLPMPTEARITRQMSSDSMSSINSLSSACSMTSQQSAATEGDIGKKKKKGKGWLRSSFSKAFSRKKNKHGSMSDVELDTASIRSNMSAPNSPLLQLHMTNGPGSIKGSHSSGFLLEAEDVSSVVDLKKQLRDKDAKLTDIRLEALSSAHQLEQLRESMNKMKNEMSNLKNDNDRLHRMVSRTNNTVCSQSSLIHTTRSSTDSLERSLSITEQTSLDMLLAETPEREGKRVTITVYLGSNPDPTRINVDVPKHAELLIGSLSVSGKTKWDILDNIVRKIFKEYVLRIDPVTNLGLSAESVFAYHIGEIIRNKEAEVPEFLPIGYLVGDTMQIGICLKGTRQNSVDSLAFETLIPKSIIQRYVSLLMEHRRIILCGPSGTGKTYLAQKLAEHLVLRSGKELTAGAVATFNVDHKSAKDLRQYLSNIADQCENTSAGELPSVIILDNLHHVNSLGEVFNGFLSCKYQKCPYIIGTMNQATCSTTNLQLHHNFRWVLCANHMEPVKGFLGRYLRRKLVEAEVHTGMRNNDLNKIIDWIPKVWLHLNKFLETHSSSDVTIGPRLFLSCPMEIAGSQVWFTDLWNYSIVPYMMEAVREGLQVYGRRANWEDPTEWVLESFPWVMRKEEEPSLLRIRPEDVGFDSQGIIATDNSSPKSRSKTGEQLTGDADPLMNMIMRLQEAANCTPSNDSDSTSIDSHGSCSVQDHCTTSGESAL